MLGILQWNVSISISIKITDYLQILQITCDPQVIVVLQIGLIYNVISLVHIRLWFVAKWIVNTAISFGALVII